jgi:hypothetical protein
MNIEIHVDIGSRARRLITAQQVCARHALEVQAARKPYYPVDVNDRSR